MNAETRFPPALSRTLDKLRAFQLDKPKALLDAEAKRAAATEKRAEADARRNALNARLRAIDQGDIATEPVSPREIERAEKDHAAACLEVNKLRDQIHDLSLEWRQKYAIALDDLILPIRRHLHATTLADLEIALQAMGEAAQRATLLDVGSTWIGRNAANVAVRVEELRRLLHVDKQVVVPPR